MVVGLPPERLRRLAMEAAASIPLPGQALLQDEVALLALESLVINVGRQLARAADHDETTLRLALDDPTDGLWRALLVAALSEERVARSTCHRRPWTGAR
ncbi:hypothetical protein [Nocardioides endophyticus]|uniref:hypothetical protein n=1 Tax=Nocardioides endophyticus TaxID=1353775 RepID=UPI0031EC03CC